MLDNNYDERMKEIQEITNQIRTAFPNVQPILHQCKNADVLHEAAKILLIEAISGKLNKIAMLIVDDLISIRIREINACKIC